MCEHAVSEYCTGKLWYLPHSTKLRSRLKWDESLCVCQRLRTGREVHESLSKRRHSLLEEVQSIVIVEQQNETPRRHHAGTLRECARRGRTRSASTENCELGGDVELELPRLARKNKQTNHSTWSEPRTSRTLLGLIMKGAVRAKDAIASCKCHSPPCTAPKRHWQHRIPRARVLRTSLASASRNAVLHTL